MKIYKRVMDTLATVEKMILVLATVLILVLTVGNVFSRKVIHQSWSFTEELVVAVFVLITLMAASFSLQGGRAGEPFTAHRPFAQKGKETHAVYQHSLQCPVYHGAVYLWGRQSADTVGKREKNICSQLAGMDFLVFRAHRRGLYDPAFH